METIENHLGWLLRANQISLQELDRERLEQLMTGLLQGQLLIFEALSQETRQSKIIRGLKQTSDHLREQLAATNAALSEATNSLVELENPQDSAYRDLFLMLIDFIMRTWDNGIDQALVLTGLWRGVELAIRQGDIDPTSPVGLWWAKAAHENFGLVSGPSNGTETEEIPYATS